MSYPSEHPRIAFIFGILLALALGVAVLGGTLWGMGTTAPLLEAWLDWDAVPAETGLTEADRAPVAKLVADVMAGRAEVFQYRGLFSAQAETHMADCTPLFRLARTVGLVGFGLSVAALGACFFFRSPRHSAAGALIGVGILLLIALALGVWGLIDFDGLFTAFHRTFFTNDDWLFPAGDLLITLMPIGFFVRCAAVAGGLWLAVLLFTAGVAGLILRRNSRKDDRGNEA